MEIKFVNDSLEICCPRRLLMRMCEGKPYTSMSSTRVGRIHYDLVNAAYIVPFLLPCKNTCADMYTGPKSE